MIPLIWPLGLALVGGMGYAGKKHLDKKKLTPERRMVFETAMEKVKDARQLCNLADQYDAVGLKAQATLLRKRAKLRSLPEAQKAMRREAMRKAFQSTDIAALQRFAAALESETAYANAAKIRAYIKTLTPNGQQAPQGV